MNQKQEVHNIDHSGSNIWTMAVQSMNPGHDESETRWGRGLICGCCWLLLTAFLATRA